MAAVPAVGEHSEAILRELGRSDAQIEAMKASQAI
jgi:formyl-CoA transferase